MTLCAATRRGRARPCPAPRVPHHGGVARNHVSLRGDDEDTVEVGPLFRRSQHDIVQDSLFHGHRYVFLSLVTYRDLEVVLAYMRELNESYHDFLVRHPQVDRLAFDRMRSPEDR